MDISTLVESGFPLKSFRLVELDFSNRYFNTKGLRVSEALLSCSTTLAYYLNVKEKRKYSNPTNGRVVSQGSSCENSSIIKNFVLVSNTLRNNRIKRK